MKKITFLNRVGFHEELRKRVDAYFDENGKSKFADWRMILKSVAIMALLCGSYISFLMSAGSPIWSILSTIAFAQGVILVGFNIMHDANHGSYSRSTVLNRIIGLSLDLVGGSSMCWRYKHNILHHTYTNINEIDDDLAVPGILRFSQGQPLHPWHQFQHWYAFPVYSFMTILWSTKSDFQKYFSGKIGDYTMPRHSIGETVLFFGVRLFYFGYILVFPMLFHPILHVLGFFFLVHAVVGITIATVFQVAHIVEASAFTCDDSTQIENEWAVHQVETTANFSPNSKLATWYCGGLNYQIEHHLFPKISHVHYPAISTIIEATCRDFNVTYVSYPTFGKAIAAHIDFLKYLGTPAHTSVHQATV